MVYAYTNDAPNVYQGKSAFIYRKVDGISVGLKETWFNNFTSLEKGTHPILNSKNARKNIKKIESNMLSLIF